MSSRATDEGDEAGEIDATDYCSWWVVSAHSSTSGCVHVPRSVRSRDGDDPDEQPPAETLCRAERRRDTNWKVRSHAQLPPGFRPVCRKCLDRIQEVPEL